MRHMIPVRTLHTRDGGRCYYCRRRTARSNEPEWVANPSLRATRDHKVPRSRGGSSRNDNIVLACSACNNAKGNLTAIEFMATAIRFGGYENLWVSAKRPAQTHEDLERYRFRSMTFKLGDILGPLMQEAAQ
jgi:hypothetical protein